MCYSYAMGIDDNVYLLKEQGFVIERDGINYMITFPNDRTLIWEEFISSNLKFEYWNEYLTDKNVVFMFHLDDGIKRYVVDDFENNEVLSLCEKLCDCKFESIKEMLLGNRFYKKMLEGNKS